MAAPFRYQSSAHTDFGVQRRLPLVDPINQAAFLGSTVIQFPATVSRVLSNQREFYSEKTAKKVREAAKKLGYQRNTSAVELVTRKSKVIAVLVSSTQTNFSNEILNGIQQEAQAHNLSVMIIFAGALIVSDAIG